MKKFKLILLIYALLLSCSASYASVIKKTDENIGKMYDRGGISIDGDNVTVVVSDVYFQDSKKTGIFFAKQTWETRNELYLHSKIGRSEYFEDGGVNTRIWQSPFISGNWIIVSFIKAKFNSKSYDIALIDTDHEYYYPRECEGKMCTSSKPVHSIDVKVVLIYNEETENWIDSKYLADQRINYFASIYGKMPVQNFSDLLKKQIKDLNIDLEDISPAAQTCHFLEPLEPCYKNLK